MIPFRKQAQTPPSDDATPMVVFGRPSGAKVDMAGLFEGKAAEPARQAAEAQKLGWFAADTPERAQAAQGLKKGGFITPGRFDLGSIDAATLAHLQALSGRAATHPAGAAAEGPQGLTEGAGEGSGGAHEPNGEAGAGGGGGDATPSGRAEFWRGIATDDIVLAPTWEKREFGGFWEARVVGFDGDDVMLEWKGYEQDFKRFWLKRAQVALLHPDYSSKP